MARTRTLAQGGAYKVYETDLGVYVQGAGHEVLYFPRDKWDLFSSVIRLADLELRGEDA